MADAESWTKNRQTPHTQDIYNGYDLWKKGHKQLQERTDAPKNGRDYVENASNLVTLLEGFAELNVIAKAVVILFKTVVTLELNRRENDAHVDIVFLSMADMMSALLDTSQFSETLSKRTKDGNLSVADKLRAEFADIEKYINVCGNSMDTYSKESRIKRFIKSAEWKARITEQITTFRNRRTKLQQILTLQTASDVNSLVDKTTDMDRKIDLLISHIFSPNSDYEKAAAKTTWQFSKMKDGTNLANNPEYLEALLQDPKLNQEGMSGNKSATVDQLQQDLRLSVEDVCEENKESFERKLHYYTEQLEKSMKTNADYIVKKLSGPYDRLKHKDLKSLWKNMKWIFCIDNDHFTSALFEYYLDHFSSIKVLKDGQVEFNDEDSSDERTTEENLTIVKDLTRRGALNHPDKWTLIPMAKYKDRIAHAIDSDDSKLIRISEVNAFTDRIPKGWTVPQWCAYAAVGWTYQARCYRKRMNYILSRMHEMQAKVLPANRDRVMTVNRTFIPFYQLLAWEPWETRTPYAAKYPIPEAVELRNLVKNKMITGDNEIRNKLNGIKWNVEDETTMEIINPEKDSPLETCVLQLSVLLLERMYQVMQTLSEATADGREIAPLTKALQYLRQMCLNRIGEVKATANKNYKNKEDIRHFYGGIWGCIDSVIVLNKGGLPFKQTDVEDFRLDENLLDEFIQDQPISHPLQDIAQEVVAPFTLQECSICHKGPGEGYRYVCTECDAIICSECYEKRLPGGPPESGHTFAHTVLRFSLDTVENRLRWMVLDAQIQKQRIIDDMANLKWDQMSFLGDDEQEAEDNAEDEEETPFRCSDCEKAIVLNRKTDTKFYKCFGHSCSGYYLCQQCSSDGANPDGHQWWHSLIVLRSQVVLKDRDREMEGEDSDAESAYSDYDKDDITVLQGKMDTLLEGQTKFAEERSRDINTNADLESRISQLLDNKISAMLAGFRGNGNGDGVSGALVSRMAQPEGKLESTVDEMRKNSNPSAPPPRAPSFPERKVPSASDLQENTGVDGYGVGGNDGRNQEGTRFGDGVEGRNVDNREENRSDGDGPESNDERNQTRSDGDGVEGGNGYDQEENRSDGDGLESNDERNQEDARSDGDGPESNDERNQENTRSDDDGVSGGNGYNQEENRSDGGSAGDDDDDDSDRNDRAQRSDGMDDDNGDPPEDSIPEEDRDF
ncbi:hypothetical protein HYPSUDRAFT_39609 [Hypholoma sublateritium FD-334 SS-4]|uniref:ZZ-type domain-containing protein n=1 Tax=Hypholoma sublateritium (strain FD-334 SS-4) TaxID=945553 RepID=A0A0D2PWB4_HYPSF|nr:hypothetical protein HYPSUDRAFT_39609 [Hypholoma sublateritium FD-334 SS-4]